jgi:hypothetical protein
MIPKFFRKNKTAENGERTNPWVRLYCPLLLLLWPAVLTAQNGVTVSNLVVDAGTLTFNVSWDVTDPTMQPIWSDTVWVWVDYNTAGTLTRLPLAPGAT